MDYFESLFSNIGKKIKGMALTMFVIELIGGIITFIVLTIALETPVWLLFIFGVPLAAYLLSLPLYAIGELIDAVQENRDYTREIYLHIRDSAKHSTDESHPPQHSTQKTITDTDNRWFSEPQNYSKNSTQNNATQGSHKWLCDCGKKIDSYPCYNCGKTPETQTSGSLTNAKENTSKKIPVAVRKKSNGKLICPVCFQMQNGDRYVCLNCGQIFINHQPDIPFWCGNCGKEGPYEGNCPDCNSSAKIYNN